MLTISGFRGVNLVDPARIARTEGLDMMMGYNVLKKRHAFGQRSEETQLPVEVARGKSCGRE